MYKKALLVLLFLVGFQVIYNCKKDNATENIKEEKENPLGFYNINFDTIFKDSENYSQEDQVIKSKIEEYYKIIWENKNLSGGLLVARGNNILFEKYTGYSDIQNKKELTASTPLHIASISKIFTSLSILKLVEGNKVNLEQKVFEFLPSFPYKEITIKDLLTHRSGLPSYEYLADDSAIWDKSKNMSNQDVLNIFVNNKIQLQSQPGTHFAYCNTNFAILALVVENIMQKPFPEVIDTMIFTPLEMKHSFVFQDKDSLRATPSYYAKGNIFPLNHLDKVYGDKNVYSTPEDLFRLSEAMYAPNFLRKDLLEMMFTPYSNEKPGIKNYGLGMRMMIFDNGKKLTYHTGWWHGNNTIFIHLLDEKVTIIALGNKYSKAMYSAIKLCSLFGDYPLNLEEFEHAETDSVLISK